MIQAGLAPPKALGTVWKAYHINQRNEGIDLGEVSGALMATQNIQMQTFVAGFSGGAGASAGSIGYNEAVSPTLKGSASGNSMPSVLCLNDQGGKVMECSEDVTGTLRAQEHGHQPLVFENHGIDARYTGPYEVAPTITSRFGTGGNNASLVAQDAEVICIMGNAIDRQPQNGGNGIGWQENIAYTLTATDRHALFSLQRSDEFKDSEVASTESARQYKDHTDLVYEPHIFGQADFGNYQDSVSTLRASGGDHGGGSENLAVAMQENTANLIRRLTPLECERLQGFPDGWTDVPGASDSARYKALGNSVAVPCVEYLMERIAMVILLDLDWNF